jgi:hypothetical protein
MPDDLVGGVYVANRAAYRMNMQAVPHQRVEAMSAKKSRATRGQDSRGFRAAGHDEKIHFIGVSAFSGTGPAAELFRDGHRVRVCPTSPTVFPKSNIADLDVDFPQKMLPR